MSRVVLTDPSGRSDVITPCSNTVENQGYSPTNFEFSRLSPDKTKVATEARFYLDNSTRYATVVYEGGETMFASMIDPLAPGPTILIRSPMVIGWFLSGISGFG